MQQCHLFSFGGIVAVLLICFLHQNDAASLASSQSTDHESTMRPKQQAQDEEQQLEKLKVQPQENVAVYKFKSQSVTNNNGKVNSVTENKEQVKDTSSGKVLAQTSQETVERQSGPNAKADKLVKSTVDIPDKGIHGITFTHNGKPIMPSRDNSESSREMNEDYFTPLQGIQYTPGDMAEYIFRTGDEDGVTLAIEELMREGVMSQNDAISYLEEVKMDLEILRARQERNRLRQLALNEESQEEQMAEARIREQRYQQALRTQEAYRQAVEEKRQLTSSKLNSFHRKGLVPENEVYDTKELPSTEPDVDYEEVVERLRLADFLSKEFSLEEIIYQLARQMFARSVVRGNNDAEEALQRFSVFLQQEEARGRISPELQRKVIDVMLAALVDTIGEHPELTAVQPGSTTQRHATESNHGEPTDPVTAEHAKSKQEKLDTKTHNKEQLTQDKSFQHKSVPPKKDNTKSEPEKKA